VIGLPGGQRGSFAARQSRHEAWVEHSPVRSSRSSPATLLREDAGTKHGSSTRRPGALASSRHSPPLPADPRRAHEEGRMPAGSRRSRPLQLPGRCAGPRCTLPVHRPPPCCEKMPARSMGPSLASRERWLPAGTPLPQCVGITLSPPLSVSGRTDALRSEPRVSPATHRVSPVVHQETV
jgi:hypothetical protein